MAYATKAQLIVKFGEEELIQRTDRDNVGIINDEVLLAAQDAADSDIDKRLRMKGWVVPLLIITDDIIAIALDLTRFYLYTDCVNGVVEAAYKRRIKELNDYVSGKIILYLGEPESTGDSAGDVVFEASDRVFTSSSLKGF